LKKNISAEVLIGIGTSSVFFLIYLKSVCPTVFWWDSGELIAAISTLGIPHRPGFPIYILLGKFFSFFPLATLTWKINLLSAIFSSLSIFFLFLIFVKIVRNFFPKEKFSRNLIFLSGTLFVVVSGFTYTFWIQAVRAEVYSLNLLFFSLMLYLVLLYKEKAQSRYLFLSFFLLGLGLGNHHATLLSTVPALLFFVLICRKEKILSGASANFSIKVLPKISAFLSGAFLFLLGLSIYLYIPIRSSFNPEISWGPTKTLSGSASSVLALETIKNFKYDFFSDFSEKIWGTILLLFHQFTPVCFFLSLLGILFLLFYAKKIFSFLMLVILGNLAVIVVLVSLFIETNPDLHGYLIFTIISFGFTFGISSLFILEKGKMILRSEKFSKEFKKTVKVILPLFFMVVSFFPFLEHRSQANLSENRNAFNWGEKILSKLEPNSFLFTNNANLHFVLRGLKYGENMRRDVTLIERGLLYSDWYVAQLKGRNKELFSRIPVTLKGEELFLSLLKNIVDQGKKAYIEFSAEDTTLAQNLIPKGLIFQFQNESVEKLPSAILENQASIEKINLLNISDDKLKGDFDAKRILALWLYRNGLFWETKKEYNWALQNYQKLLELDPCDKNIEQKVKSLGIYCNLP
jgi:hypothetical protein